MASVRLTNYMRDNVIRKAIEVSFKSQLDQLLAEENSLAMRAYNEATPLNVQRSIDLFPNKDQWFRTTKELKFNANGYQVILKFANSVPYRMDASYYNVYHNIKDYDLGAEIQAFANKQETYKKKRSEATNKLKALVYSFTTVKALQDAWPEGKPFYQQYLDYKGNPLPTVVFDDINKTLGLPIEEETKAA